MESYKEIYYRLFNRLSDVIEILKSIQLEAETLFVENGEKESVGPSSVEQ